MYTDAGTTANFPLDVGDKEVKGSLDDGLINGPSDSSEVAKTLQSYLCIIPLLIYGIDNEQQAGVEK